MVVVRRPVAMDEEGRREEMEASENTALPRRGSDHSLHRIDPDRISKIVSRGADSAGYDRLSLMVGTIFDRLVSDDRPDLPGS
jgi:hypothetical protein